jgi:hypothetical protein
MCISVPFVRLVLNPKQHPSQRELAMQLETILNRCYKLKGFVYAKAQWQVCNNGEPVIAVHLRPHKKSNHLAVSQTQRFGEIQSEGDEVPGVARSLQ